MADFMKPETSMNTADANRVGSMGGSASVAYDVFMGNNDYDATGMTPAETLADISFELETAMSAVLLLRHGMTKAEALKAVDDLRWLVDKSDLPNVPDEPRDQK